MSSTDPLLEEMQQPGGGVATKNRKVLRPLAMGYNTYKGCFAGSDAVSWVATHHSGAYPSRQQAVRLLQTWLDQGVIRTVGRDESEKRFEDDKGAYYQFATASASAAGEERSKRRKNLPRFRAGREQPSYEDASESALMQLLNGPLFASRGWVPIALVKAKVSRSKAKGKPARVRDQHFLVLCSSGQPPSDWSLQLGRYNEGKTEYRLTEAWPLRSIGAIDRTDEGFFVRMRRDGDVSMEYRFVCSHADSMLAAVLRCCSLARVSPKTAFEVKGGAGGGSSGGGVGGGALSMVEGAEVNIDAFENESLQLSGDDLEAQQLFWQWMQQHSITSALTAQEALEEELRKSERLLMHQLLALDEPLRNVHAQVEAVTSTVDAVEHWLDESAPAVREGDRYIREIRGHRARREREQRHIAELVDTLQLLMSSLSVPPRLLALLREPSFASDDASDMVAALHAIDKVITLKDLDQRLLRMRAVSDRSAEYRHVMESFANALLVHCHGVLGERAAARAAVLCTSPPTPLHVHLEPFRPVFLALPRTLIPPLLDDYISSCKPVYLRDFKQYCSHLLQGVRKKEHQSVEGFAAALEAVSQLLQVERTYWMQFDDGEIVEVPPVSLTVSGGVSLGGNTQPGGGAGTGAAAEGETGAKAAYGRSTVAHAFDQGMSDILMLTCDDLASFLDYSSRHNSREVIGLQSVCDEWRSRNSCAVVDAIAHALNTIARVVLNKYADDAIATMREGHMTRSRTGPLLSFTRFPALLDDIHFYGVTPVTPVVCERIVTSMLEWLESPEVVKELIKFDSSKKTIYAGRLENYFFLRAVLDTHVQKCSYLAPYSAICAERYEHNLQAYMVFIYEHRFESLHGYFTAVSKLMKTVPAQEIQFQVSLSRSALQTLNRKYSASMWEKKMVKLYKSVSTNISNNMVPIVWRSFCEFLEAKVTLYLSLIHQCYGTDLGLSVTLAEVQSLCEAATKAK